MIDEDCSANEMFSDDPTIVIMKETMNSIGHEDFCETLRILFAVTKSKPFENPFIRCMMSGERKLSLQIRACHEISQ